MKVVGELKCSWFFWIFIGLSVFALMYGITGESILTSGYGRNDASRSSLHEYFILFILLAIFSMNRNRLGWMVIYFISIAYSAKSLLYGGRIEIAMLWLMIFYLKFNFFKRQRLLVVLCAVFLFLVFDMVANIRANPAYFLQNPFELFSTSVAIHKDFLENQFGDVYQASTRIVGLVDEGYISTSERVMSLMIVLFGILPSSWMPDYYNLASYLQDVATSGGGGLLPAFSFVWMSYLGPIFFGLFIGLAIRFFHTTDRLEVATYGLLVLILFPRWFSYYPVVLFKMALFGVVAVSMMRLAFKGLIHKAKET